MYSIRQKFGHRLIPGFFFILTIFYIVENDYFDYFLHQNYEITHMESFSNQKSVKQIKIYLYLRFFKVATLCLDDSFAHFWHSLNQLHEVVT